MASSDYLSHREMGKLRYIGLARAFLLASSFVIPSFASAAVQLNDHELDQKYLQDEKGAIPIDVEQVYRQTQLKQLDKILFTFIPVDSLSTLTFVLNDGEREKSLDLGVFKFANSFGEVASYEFGSEPYSYRWSGNYDQIYDVSRFQHFYYNTFTGDYELDGNIHGRIDLEVSVYSDGRRNTLLRNNYAF